MVRVSSGRIFNVRDTYARLLHISWPSLIFACLLGYAAINALFASLYLNFEPCIEGATPGSWWDAFFFSVQTISTVGYGGLKPQGTCGNALASLELLVGVLSIALVTGIVFTKFARPRAGVIFTDKAIIENWNGQPHLMFRLANARGNDIVAASLRVTVVLEERSAEGRVMRRLHDLQLVRDHTPILLMSWLVMHPIDAQSPLYGKSLEDFRKDDIRIIANMTGMDGAFMQHIYLYHTYTYRDIVEQAYFADVIAPLPDGRYQLDLRKFNHVHYLNDTHG